MLKYFFIKLKYVVIKYDKANCILHTSVMIDPPETVKGVRCWPEYKSCGNNSFTLIILIGKI